MRFRKDCFANAYEACFVVAEGTLDSGAAERFEELISQEYPPYQVLLNSPGGNLRAGLELGRAIRARGISTVIGRWDDTGRTSEQKEVGVGGKVVKGECLSACSYAFLGGVIRALSKGSRIGFHQFALPGGGELKGQGGLSSGQQISAFLISYIIEMGADARLFSLASSAVRQQHDVLSDVRSTRRSQCGHAPRL
jgi:hypothetical protein